MAPEVLMKNKYSEKADVYSMGIVLVEIFTGIYPYSDGKYQHMNQAQLMMQICQQNARPMTDDLPVSLQQLVFDCWHQNPSLRPNFPEIVTRLRRLQGVEFPTTLRVVSQSHSSNSGGSSSSFMPSSFDSRHDSGFYGDFTDTSSSSASDWNAGSFPRILNINTGDSDVESVRDVRQFSGTSLVSPFSTTAIVATDDFEDDESTVELDDLDPLKSLRNPQP